MFRKITLKATNIKELFLGLNLKYHFLFNFKFLLLHLIQFLFTHMLVKQKNPQYFCQNFHFHLHGTNQNLFNHLKFLISLIFLVIKSFNLYSEVQNSS